MDDWQFAAGTGVSIPFSNDQSTNGFLSLHASREITPWFIPLVELNWFQVIDAGNGNPAFSGQAGGVVPTIVEFEGHDFFNLDPSPANDQEKFKKPPPSAMRSDLSYLPASQ